MHSVENTSDECKNIQYLPGIALLAEQGHIELYSSAELKAERFRQPVGRYSGYGYWDYNVLGKARIDSVDGLPPMTISLFGSSGASAGAQRQRLDQTDDPRYHSLAKLLGPKNSQDAWHIRTAETHKMFCFLTMDFSLMRALDSQQGHELLKSLATRIMTPTEFGRYFGIAPVPSQILSYNDASVPVRSDLHWPDENRKRRCYYRRPE